MFLVVISGLDMYSNEISFYQWTWYCWNAFGCRLDFIKMKIHSINCTTLCVSVRIRNTVIHPTFDFLHNMGYPTYLSLKYWNYWEEVWVCYSGMVCHSIKNMSLRNWSLRWRYIWFARSLYLLASNISKAPEQFTLKSANKTSLTFTWKAPTDNSDGIIISKYNIECSRKHEKEIVLADNIKRDALNAMVEGLAVYTVYKCKVSDSFYILILTVLIFKKIIIFWPPPPSVMWCGVTTVATWVAILPGVDNHFISAHCHDTWSGENHWVWGSVVSYNYKLINVFDFTGNQTLVARPIVQDHDHYTTPPSRRFLWFACQDKWEPKASIILKT